MSIKSDISYAIMVGVGVFVGRSRILHKRGTLLGTFSALLLSFSKKKLSEVHNSLGSFVCVHVSPKDIESFHLPLSCRTLKDSNCIILIKERVIFCII